MNKNRIRTLEAQIDEKNKNIEARQNVTDSYKKKSVSSQKKLDLIYSFVEIRFDISSLVCDLARNS